MRTLFLDTETFCETPITNGVFAYAEKVEVMIVAYAIDDGEVKAWDVTEVSTKFPKDLAGALYDPSVEIALHNPQFDRTVTRLSGVFDMPLDRIHDTMARARAHSLPGGLGKLCEILGVPSDQAKDKAGKSLIQLFCKPRPKNMELRRATRETHPTQWAQFIEYAKSDIEAMRVIYKKLPRWNSEGRERLFWEADAIINERGVAVDLELVNSAITAIGETTEGLSRKTAEATGDEVQKTTQRNKLLEYINRTYGVQYMDLTSSMVDKAINDENTPGALRELLLLRAEASQSSTAKYKKFRDATSSDGRLRGMFVYCGASRTGRDAGNIVQLQNLPRPTMKNAQIEMGIDALKAGCADLLFPSVMGLSSNAIRGCLVPAQGKKFVIADLANIEGRVCAWLAGEEWKLQAFRDYDTILGYDGEGEPIRKGPDNYKLAYARAFRVAIESVTKEQRQVGKVMELMLQYAGGVGAFVTGANAYGIDLEDLADRAWDNIPSAVKEDARKWWAICEKEKRTQGLSERAFIVCDSLKRMWRAAHPSIVGLWSTVEGHVKAMAALVPNGGHEYTESAGMLKFIRKGAWSRIVLPSGRSLCYPSMRLN